MIFEFFFKIQPTTMSYFSLNVMKSIIVIITLIKLKMVIHKIGLMFDEYDIKHLSKSAVSFQRGYLSFYTSIFEIP